MASVVFIAQIVFWCCLGAVLSTYVAYPVSLTLLTLVRSRSHRTEDITPSVTFVISAFNEAQVIRKKVENTLSLDYPPEKLEILVISDASDDLTDEVVRSFSGEGVQLCRQETRGGKSAGLTRFLPQARGDIVVFSDANSIYERSALRRLVRHFADPTVGYVVGRQRYVRQDQSAVSSSERLYWRYELLLKLLESRLGSVVGGDGAIYAIRTHLFQPLKDDDINDFANPLQIVLQGYRGVFEPGAVCYEPTADSFAGEFRRKVRIVNRSLRGLLRLPQVLNPFRVGWFAYQITLHKLVRWFVPYFLLLLFVANVVLAFGTNSLMYRTALTLELAFCICALLQFVPGARKLKPIYFAYYFCLANVAAALGIATFFLRRRFATWNPERPAGESRRVTLGTDRDP